MGFGRTRFTCLCVWPGYQSSTSTSSLTRILHLPFQPGGLGGAPGASSSRYVIVLYEAPHLGRPYHAMVPRGVLGRQCSCAGASRRPSVDHQGLSLTPLHAKASVAVQQSPRFRVYPALADILRQASPRGREVAAIQLKTMFDGNGSTPPPGHHITGIGGNGAGPAGR